MSDIYKAPQSALSDSEVTILPTSIWLLLLGHLYFWPKILNYIGLFSFVSDTEDILRLSINIPIYVAYFFCIVRFRSGGRLFFKLWFLVALADEIIMTISDFNPNDLVAELVDLVYYFPLYFVPFYYAYRSEYLWSQCKPWSFYRSGGNA